MNNIDDRKIKKVAVLSTMSLSLSLLATPALSFAPKQKVDKSIVSIKKLPLDRLELQYFARLEDGRHVVVMQPKLDKDRDNKLYGYQVYFENKSKLQPLIVSTVHRLLDGGTELIVTSQGTFVFPSESAMRRNMEFTLSKSTRTDSLFPPKGIPMKLLPSDETAKEEIRKLGLPLSKDSP